MGKNLSITKNQIRGILQYLKKCIELMKEKPEGTSLNSEFDGLNSIIKDLEEIISE